MVNIVDLRKQKIDLIGKYKISKDKAVRKQIRLLDSKIKGLLVNNDTRICSV